MFTIDTSPEFVEELWRADVIGISAAIVRQILDNDDSMAEVCPWPETRSSFCLCMAMLWRDMSFRSPRHENNNRFAVEAIEGGMMFLLESMSVYAKSKVQKGASPN